MALVSVGLAMGLTGKGRSSLYRDMAKGRLSYSSGADGGRLIDTSELIRVYGELRPAETVQWDGLRQGDETSFKGVPEAINALVSEITALREEVKYLREEIRENTLRLEHKAEPEPETPPVDPVPVLKIRKWWHWRK